MPTFLVYLIFNRFERVPEKAYHKSIYNEYPAFMREGLDLPNIPEYVSIKEAAKLLGVSDKRVYAYIEDGRLPAMRAAHVIMIPIEEIKRFKPLISGRPRKHTPSWRTSPEDNMLLTTSIQIPVKGGQQQQLQRKLEEIRRSGKHTFPGTVARYIIVSKRHPGSLEILLVWRSTTALDEAGYEQAMDEFRRATADVLDWSVAEYDDGEALLHT